MGTKSAAFSLSFSLRVTVIGDKLEGSGCKAVIGECVRVSQSPFVSKGKWKLFVCLCVRVCKTERESLFSSQLKMTQVQLIDPTHGTTTIEPTKDPRVHCNSTFYLQPAGGATGITRSSHTQTLRLTLRHSVTHTHT